MCTEASSGGYLLSFELLEKLLLGLREILLVGVFSGRYDLNPYDWSG